MMTRGTRDTRCAGQKGGYTQKGTQEGGRTQHIHGGMQHTRNALKYTVLH